MVSGLLYLRLAGYGRSFKRTAVAVGLGVMTFFLVPAFKPWPDPASALKSSGGVFVPALRS